MRDYRRRSRDRDSRAHRDDSRDRDRRRQDGSADSRRKRRDDSRDRTYRPATNGSKVRFNPAAENELPKPDANQSVKTPTPPPQTDEEKRAERLAKLEAWKQRQAAEKDRKQKEAEASGGTRKLLAEIDKKANASPIIASPKSPLIPAGSSEPSSPAPYAGKFDPKAIARKAAATSSGVSKLGTDVAVPEIAKASATITSNKTGPSANNPAALVNRSTGKLKYSRIHF